MTPLCRKEEMNTRIIDGSNSVLMQMHPQLNLGMCVSYK